MYNGVGSENINISMNDKIREILKKDPQVVVTEEYMRAVCKKVSKQVYEDAEDAKRREKVFEYTDHIRQMFMRALQPFWNKDRHVYKVPREIFADITEQVILDFSKETKKFLFIICKQVYDPQKLELSKNIALQIEMMVAPYSDWAENELSQL